MLITDSTYLSAMLGIGQGITAVAIGATIAWVVQWIAGLIRRAIQGRRPATPTFSPEFLTSQKTLADLNDILVAHGEAIADLQKRRNSLPH